MGSNNKWTQEEINILKNNNDIDMLLKLLPGRNKRSIQIKASRLGISLPRKDLWTERENKIILNNLHLSLSELNLLLPNRTKCAITAQLKKLGVKLDRNSSSWKYEELMILYNNQDKTIKQLEELLPNKTKQSIISRIKLENLNYIKKYDIIDGKAKCTHCGKIKNYNNKNFPLTDNVNIRTCRDCKAKISMKTKYKLKYNINLDEQKCIDTYLPYEWYDFYYTNKIKKLPYEVSRDINKMDKIIKYAISNYLRKTSRQDILTITHNDLKKLRLGNITNKSSLWEVLNRVYPEYKIKPWELQFVPNNFWHNKKNADDYMKWFIKNYINLSEINIKNEIPNIFTVSNLRKINNHKLNACIHYYNHYNSYYEWLNHLFPWWNLEESDFKENIVNDGVKLNSNEELKIYEYIKDKLKFNIKAIGLSRSTKYKYYNKEYNEYYIPDFIINKNIKKPLIIEYFGLFNENKSSGIYKDYNEKTLRKIKYFKSKNDIYFIDLYPSDILFNFKGVNKKLTPFYCETSKNSDGGDE